MADKIKNTNVPSESPSIEKVGAGKSGRHEKAEKEIKDKSKELVEGVSEVVEGAETAENVETTGEVSEEMSEGKKKAPSGASGKGGISSSAVQAQQPPPSIEIMRIQVATQIRNEIRLLEKEAARLMRSSRGFHPFQLNRVVAKIRELKDILSSLAYATTETIKGWWSRFVKGITP